MARQPKTLRLQPGGALRLPEYYEVNGPTLVKVSPAVARRVIWVRTQHLNDHEHTERHCAVFRDPKTKVWYAQPIAEDE